MTLSKYFFLALFLIATMAYSSKIPAQYESTAMGATVGIVAGAVLTGFAPLGMLGGVIVGGLIGDKMDTTAPAKH